MKTLDRMKRVEVEDGVYGATMMLPYPDLEWELRWSDYSSGPVLRKTIYLLAAEAIASYRYLIQSCPQKEVWRRIKILRKALDEYNQGETTHDH